MVRGKRTIEKQMGREETEHIWNFRKPEIWMKTNRIAYAVCESFNFIRIYNNFGSDVISNTIIQYYPNNKTRNTGGYERLHENNKTRNTGGYERLQENKAILHNLYFVYFVM